MLAVAPPPPKAQSPRKHEDHTAIVDSGASGLYLSKHALTINFDPTAPKINVGTASGQPHQYSGAAYLGLPNLPPDFPRAVKVMPSFRHTLIGLGPICDANFKVTFTKKNVIIYNQGGSPIITVWRERNGDGLWRIALTPTREELPTIPNSAYHTNI